MAVYEKRGNIGPGFYTISGNKGAIERQIYIHKYVTFLKQILFSEVSKDYFPFQWKFWEIETTV